MLQEITVANNLDTEGKPAGGSVEGIGLSIAWQNGPLGRGAERKAPNGAFVETVILAAMQRIEFYQRCGFKCSENAAAIELLRAALQVLHARTRRREALGVEGTHEIAPGDQDRPG